MTMQQLTIFSWGYYGWGNATSQFVRAVDAVERAKGFDRPIFVDTRIRRSVRAKGFSGPAFEKLVGPGRHVWMKALGNKWVLSHQGPMIQIADPKASADLVDLALSGAEKKRRILFFCSCQWPRWNGGRCHRTEVTNLVLQSAKERKIPVQIAEWPGGETQQVHLEPKPEVFKAVKRGRMTIPLDQSFDLALMGGLPWCSIATLHSGDNEIHRVVGPVMCQQGRWALPVLWMFNDPDASIAEYRHKAQVLRNEWGLGTSSV